MSRHIAIIGAGPIGLEAALAAQQAGFTATVYESGAIADSVRRWGHIRLFSPFSMNASAAGKALLSAEGVPLPDGDACLTGDEYVESYLEPLARRLDAHTRTRVKSIIRENSGKRDKIGEPERADTPFRLTVEKDGMERHVHADIILDCGGTFQNPNPTGDGGVPALGEAAAQSRISHGVEDSRDPAFLAGKRVLVVGGGHSAANLIASLAALKDSHPQTELYWAVRQNDGGGPPCQVIPDDPLAERARICTLANEAAASGKVHVLPRAVVISLKMTEAGLAVLLRTATGEKTITVDRLCAATGFRPDWSPARELHIQTCWATEGTYPLAASLLGEAGGDCLAVPVQGADTLLHPEPDYYALGMKSYGRTPAFLIATGLRQIEALFEKIGANR